VLNWKAAEVMPKAMAAFGRAVQEGPQEVRVRHLESLKQLLHVENPQTSAAPDDDLLAITESWFLQLANRPMGLIVEIFKQPFVQVHCASGEILKSLASQPWAQILMAKEAGFLEYLLNRSTEHDMEGHYVKFEIVEVLSKSPTIDRAFDASDLQKLKNYLAQGPYFVKAQTDVAFEEA